MRRTRSTSPSLELSNLVVKLDVDVIPLSPVARGFVPEVGVLMNRIRT
jgi:hypothetical protein